MYRPGELVEVKEYSLTSKTTNPPNVWVEKWVPAVVVQWYGMVNMRTGIARKDILTRSIAGRTWYFEMSMKDSKVWQALQQETLKDNQTLEGEKADQHGKALLLSDDTTGCLL